MNRIVQINLATNQATPSQNYYYSSHPTIVIPPLVLSSFLPAFRGEGYGNGVPGLVLSDIGQRRGPRRVRVGAERGGGVGAGATGGRPRRRRRRSRSRRRHPPPGPAVDRRLPRLGQRERVARQDEVHAVHVRPVRHHGLAAQQAELDALQRLLGVGLRQRRVHDLQGPSFFEQLPCLNTRSSASDFLSIFTTQQVIMQGCLFFDEMIRAPT